jgi:hypothetical protein
MLHSAPLVLSLWLGQIPAMRNTENLQPLKHSELMKNEVTKSKI